jgi:hypothetical protein
MRVDYSIKDRDTVITGLIVQGKRITEETLINLDVQGVPQTCYFIVEDAPTPQPDLLAEADARILQLEYENLLLKGGVA